MYVKHYTRNFHRSLFNLGDYKLAVLNYKTLLNTALQTVTRRLGTEVDLSFAKPLILSTIVGAVPSCIFVPIFVFMPVVMMLRVC